MDYDQETVDLYREAIETHEKLAPYIWDQVQNARSRTGDPIMRPLFFTSRRTRRVTRSTTSGCSATLLAAPLVSDAQSRDMRIPPGRWYDVTRSRVVQGPTTLRNYSAELGETPVFVRLGRLESRDLMRAVAHW